MASVHFLDLFLCRHFLHLSFQHADRLPHGISDGLYNANINHDVHFQHFDEFNLLQVDKDFVLSVLLHSYATREGFKTTLELSFHDLIIQNTKTWFKFPYHCLQLSRITVAHIHKISLKLSSYRSRNFVKIIINFFG